MRTPQQPQAVTTARRSRQEDRAARMRFYVIVMSFRILAFPLSVWALLTGHIVIGSVLAVAAVLIPSFAVMFANNVDHRDSTETPRSPVRALPPGHDRS